MIQREIAGVRGPAFGRKNRLLWNFSLSLPKASLKPGLSAQLLRGRRGTHRQLFYLFNDLVDHLLLRLVDLGVVGKFIERH